MRRVEEEGRCFLVVNGQGPELARRNIWGDAQPIGICARQPSTTLFKQVYEVEAARAELGHWSEEAGKGNPPRIHVEVVGHLPQEFCLYADGRSDFLPF